ncbi:hypothetical protein IEO21_07130 [Rhodonia placenta]|uniref:Uncharacterized protein n=1 Tax=Rhodonia placenta TaxID=104341 RepID=A0A8H7U0L7_9APHY|nr:hypothetical protein IEO21_07130 [Postia placenta]
MGEKIHSDLWGAARIATLGARKYYISFTDDKTRYSALYLLRLKSEAFDAFKAFEAWCRDLGSSDRGKPKSWGRPTDSHRSDGERGSNLRLGTSKCISQGRLCALVRAQLVRAQHADAAPGAVDNDASVSGM